MKIFSRVLVALALVVGATLVAPVTPAQADPPALRLICFEASDGVIRLVPCYDLGKVSELLQQKPLPIGCPQCQPYLHLVLQINPQAKIQFFEQFAVGLRLLSDSDFAPDPQTREHLRYQATQTLVSAVRNIGPTPVYVAQFGYVDLDTHQVYQHQSMYPVAINLQQGIALMQQSGAAGPLNPAAMSRFQDAVRAFAMI